MVDIFYKSNGKIVTADAVGVLDSLGLDDVVWIDLFTPSGDEKRSVEAFLDTTLQSRATAEEIESSSRYSENDTTIFVNTNFMIPSPEKYTMESVSFILHEGIMVSVRNAPLRSFTDIQRKLVTNFKAFPTGYHVMLGILENRVDMDADMIELMSKEIAQYSKRVSLGENVGEKFLLDINQLQENTMMVRENIVDKQRMISSIIRSDKFPRDVVSKMNILLKDVSSLINHTNFSFERLEYLQNTVLGLINLEQNKIMKIFTFVSLLLTPPMLIASIYGMNVALPSVGGLWDFFIVLFVMLISVFCAFLIFRHRHML
jgi:magnesium transporter